MGREKEAAVKITYIMKRRLSVNTLGLFLLYFCHYITIVYSLLIRKERKMNGEEIKKLLENHKKWLNNELGGIRAQQGFISL